MRTLDIKKLGWVLSVFGMLAFVVCFVWGSVIPEAVRPLHLQLLQMSYVGFSGMNLASFASGLVQTFVWGWIVAAVFGWLWNRFAQ